MGGGPAQKSHPVRFFWREPVDDSGREAGGETALGGGASGGAGCAPAGRARGAPCWDAARCCCPGLDGGGSGAGSIGAFGRSREVARSARHGGTQSVRSAAALSGGYGGLAGGLIARQTPGEGLCITRCLPAQLLEQEGAW